MLNHVDLCSGIGGFALGFQWAQLSNPILFCDIEPWCRQVLKKNFPDVPVAEDVKEIANEPERFIQDRVDILTAGYPCQPFSVAGKQKGTEDDRHIWPYIFRIVTQKRPTWCVFENVYGHVALGLDQVLADLEAEGYATRTFIVPACGVNAPHRRDRLWIVGHTEDNGRDRGAASARREGKTHQQVEQSSVRSKLSRPSENVAYADNEGPQRGVSGRQDSERQSEHGYTGCSSSIHRQPTENWWAVEPAVGRVAHGIPKRVDRLKGLGNAIVPQIAMNIGLAIREANNHALQQRFQP